MLGGRKIVGGHFDLAWMGRKVPYSSLRITGFLYFMRCSFFILSYIYIGRQGISIIEDCDVP